MSDRLALYPGSFDLLTNGHVDIIRRAQLLFDRLIVGVGRNPRKQDAMFSAAERVAILKEVCAPWERVEVALFDGLTIDFACELEAQFIVRGLRAVSDFEYELQLALTNHKLSPEIQTVFLPADQDNIFISSSVVREVWRHGADVSGFVPPAMLRALDNKQAGMETIGP